MFKLRHRRNWFVALLGFIMAATFLWLAIKDVNFDELQLAFRNARLEAIIPFPAALIAFYWLKAIRWSQLLRPTIFLEPKQLRASMMIGFAANNLLPIRIGELIRVYVIRKQHNVSYTAGISSLVVERFLDLFAVFTLLTVSVAFLPNSQDEINSALKVLGIIMLALLLVGFILLKAHSAIQTLIKKIGVDSQQKLYRAYLEFRQGLTALSNVRRAALIIFNTLAQWLLMAICIKICLVSFNIDIPDSAAAVLLGLIVVGISLPAAPGYIGTIEYCFVLGLSWFEVDSTRALAAGILYHALSFLLVTGAGLYYLRASGKRLSTLRNQATSASMEANPH